MLSKEQAQEALASCDLSNRENFKSYVQVDLENIFAEDAKNKKTQSHEVVLEEDE
jgi:hypothetical protein